jgi:hypothetical protein
MKKVIFLTSVVLMSLSIQLKAQDVKKEAENVKTKMEVFSSKTGVITKFIDSKLPNLKALYTSAETRIRKVKSGNTETYFYQIEKEGKYNSSTASIEYSDLLEVIKAVKTLKAEVEVDITNNPDYMENKFTTVDGLQVGYYISNGKATWYIRLEKYGSDNTLFVADGNTIETAFTDAKNKIDELKNKAL